MKATVGMPLDLPEALQEWLQRSDYTGSPQLPKLVPERPGSDGQPLLERLRTFSSSAFARKIVSATDGIALRAGLFQWHDFLDECHELVQSIEGEGRNHLGDYWHAIVHRREPDYSNAKYWLRHVGRNPIFEPLQECARNILDSGSVPDFARWRPRLISDAGWDPFAFVDFCEHCAGDEGSAMALAARRIQQQEMALLIELTYRQCVGIAV